MDESDLVQRIEKGKGDLVRIDRSVLLNAWGMLLIQEELVSKVDRLCLKHGFRCKYDQTTEEFRFRAG